LRGPFAKLRTTDFGQPTAATTRWRVAVLPSTPLPVPASVVLDGVSSWSGAAGVKVLSWS
jgi:hypothetical protein